MHPNRHWFSGALKPDPFVLVASLCVRACLAIVLVGWLSVLVCGRPATNRHHHIGTVATGAEQRLDAPSSRSSRSETQWSHCCLRYERAVELFASAKPLDCTRSTESLEPNPRNVSSPRCLDRKLVLNIPRNHPRKKNQKKPKPS